MEKDNNKVAVWCQQI